MLQPPPAEPGMSIDEVDTPALLIDLDAFEHNLDHMAAVSAKTGVKLRPHAKTHKSPVVAKLQMARGAVGQCVQKVAEAEALAWGGVPDILVSNEVVSPPHPPRPPPTPPPPPPPPAIASAAAMTRQVVDDLKAVGLDCPIVGGAGTGTFSLEAASGVFTELQVGSYAFMDADYGRNDPPPPFRHALFVLGSVMSALRPDFAVVDVGHKGVAVDSGLPLVWGRTGVTYVGASDEHGNLKLEAGAAPMRLGEKVWLVPGHCDPTVDRYDWYVGVRGGRVECLWPVAARGAMA